MMTDVTTLARAAAQSGGAEPSGSSGLPQFDGATFEPQIIWLLVSFLALYFVVSRLVLPRISQVLEDREERIAADLDAAERMREEARTLHAGVEGMLADARSGALTEIQAAKDEMRAALEAAQADLDTALNAEVLAAEERSAQALAAALEDVVPMATDVASALIAQVGGTAADKDVVSKAVSSAARL